MQSATVQYARDADARGGGGVDRPMTVTSAIARAGARATVRIDRARERGGARRARGARAVTRATAGGTDGEGFVLRNCGDKSMAHLDAPVLVLEDDVEFPDPAALRAYHATLYPAILNAEMVDTGIIGGAHITEYRRAVGTKG